MTKKLNERFLEDDLNPFIIFSSSGKLLRYNLEAEYLLSFASQKELYLLALNHAPQNFGTKVSQTNLRFDRYTFCALLVGYISDEEIGIRLYKEMKNSVLKIRKDNLTTVNIYTLLQLSKNSVLSNSKLKVSESFDPTIPEVKLNVEKFLKLLNRVFEEYLNLKEIDIRVSLKIGRNILIDGKSYSLCNIAILCEETKIQNSDILHALANEANVMVIIKKNKVIVEFPIIT